MMPAHLPIQHRHRPWSRSARFVAWLLVLAWVQVLPRPVQADETMPMALIDLSAEEQATREIAFEVARALKKSKQVQYVELDGALNLGGEEIQKDSAKTAEQLVKSGVAKLKAGNFEDAAEDLANAVDNYLIAYAVLADSTVLGKTLALLGAAHLLDGDQKTALKTLERAVQSDQKAPLDLSEWSPKAQSALDTARKTVAAREPIDFEVRTDPPNARVYVNGRYMGLTPTFAQATKGEQFITISKQGFVRKARKVTVDKGGVVIEERLEAARRAPAFDALKKDLVTVLAGGPARSLGEVEGLTGTPYVLLLQALGSRENMQIELALAGLNSRQIIHKVKRTLNLDTPKATREQIEKMVEEVLKPRVIAAGVDPGVVAAKPIYQRWWFWGLVAAVAGGSVAAYTLTSGEPAAPTTYKAGTGGLILQF